MNRFMIIAASGRALAQSAQNAGFAFDVFDQFGDWDLDEICRQSPEMDNRNIRINSFFDVFRKADFRRYQAAIVIGGFESRTELVRQMENHLPVLGCDSTRLDRFFNVSSVAVRKRIFEQCGAGCPATLHNPPVNSESTAWLVKKLKGSGGKHVRPLLKPWQTDGSCEGLTDKDDTIYQQHITGESYSALFASWRSTKLSDIDVDFECGLSRLRRYCCLIGGSYQLVGEPCFGASQFAYCGSIGPIQFPIEQQETLERLGQAVANNFEIDGLFGMDFLVNSQGVWPVDINPRIPASAELYERVCKQANDQSFSVFRTHLECCRGDFHEKGCVPCQSDGFLAKGILFCREVAGYYIDEPVFECLERHFQLPSLQQIGSWNTASFADIPNLGTKICLGEPILTIFVRSKTVVEANDHLRYFAEQAYTCLESFSLA